MRWSMLKRDIRLFVRSLISAAVLTAVFAAVCAAAAFSARAGAERLVAPVQTAVVDGEDSLLSRLVVSAVRQMDYVTGAMEVTSCTMEEAMEGLETGKFAAVVVLPEGTMDGIMTGRETKGTIYLSSAAAAHTDLVTQTAAFGEVMLAAGQYGVFSGEELIWEHGLDEWVYQEFLARCNALLLTEAMGAGSAYFEFRVTDYADTSLSTAAYYLVVWLAFLILLIPMLFSGLYTEDLRKPILCRLRGLGITDGAFLLGKFLLPALFLCGVLIASVGAAGRFVGLELTVGTALCALLGVLTAALWGGGLMMVLKHGVPVTAAVSAAGLLLCGGLIPRQALPEMLRVIGSLTPVGAVQSLFLPLFGGKPGWLSLLAAAVCAVGMPALAAWRIRSIRIGGDAL